MSSCFPPLTERWPQCANVTDKACGCIDYKWNHTAFSAFVREVERLGINEIDVWRQDMTPPPGTTASIPDWLLSELVGFLKRGEELEEGDEDRRMVIEEHKLDLEGAIPRQRTCTSA